MNRVVLVGRLVKDPEVKKTPNDISVCQFTIAVDRAYQQNGQKQSDFINCVVWRGQADNLAKYMRKGNQIGVDGRLQSRSYEDNGGVKRYVTEVICDSIQFLQSKSSDAQPYVPEVSNDPFASFTSGTSNASASNDPFASLQTSSGISDDDLPF